jgi:CheY-like chemotaxis protein
MQKLLLADDSVTIQRVIELTFSGEDIEVVAVNDGEQAIARIPTEHPDIVLADIGMPKKGGYDVAAFVKGRADLEHIPVLLLAGAFEPVDQARAEQVRCDGVLIKPFEPRQVIERVRELLDGMKGSPAQATADVLRPERLSPRPEPQLISVPAAPPASSPATPPPSALQSDLALDDYFESLNSAFESVGHAHAPSIAEAAGPPIFEVMPAAPVHEAERTNGGATPNPGRRRGDALDDYFDRLSTAFEQAKPPSPPQLHDGFDELVAGPRMPTLASLVGVNGKAEGNGSGAHAAPMNGHHERPRRNPIVEALEAMLASPDTAPATPAQPTLPGMPDALARGSGSGPVRSELTDAVTERVLERLVPEITATVQRLVQEEVDRIRRHH